ncbi:hypothetical protein BaRGS_00032444, partial [Batillaria attramentaria]
MTIDREPGRSPPQYLSLGLEGELTGCDRRTHPPPPRHPRDRSSSRRCLLRSAKHILCFAAASPREQRPVMFHDCVILEAGIGCYKCKSMNGSNPACGDPFNPFNNTYYHRLCNETLPPRIGLFPAKYCTKIKGIN